MTIPSSEEVFGHSVHVWSDLHLGHDLIAGIRGYESTSAHDDAILGAIEEYTSPGDRLFLTGDLFLSGGQFEDFLAACRGRQVWFTRGNHDRTSDWPQEIEDFFIAGYKELDYASFRDMGPAGESGRKKLRAYFSHFPLWQWSGRERGVLNLCGHCHGNREMLPGQADVGVEVSTRIYGEPRPIELSRLLEWKDIDSYWNSLIG